MNNNSNRKITDRSNTIYWAFPRPYTIGSWLLHLRLYFLRCITPLSRIETYICERLLSQSPTGLYQDLVSRVSHYELQERFYGRSIGDQVEHLPMETTILLLPPLCSHTCESQKTAAFQIHYNAIWYPRHEILSVIGEDIKSRSW